jgi:hypothetical protein
MSAVCSRCSQVFDDAACPRCGTPPPIHDFSPAPAHGPRWQQTGWGRILIGLILSQGLFYGLRHLTTGLLLVADDGDAEAMWNDVRNLLILQGIQLFGVLVGSILAGGGQRSGFFLGAVVGAWNGVLVLLLRQNPAQELNLVGMVGQPLLHAFVGSLGGAFGSLVWKPIPATAVPVSLAPPRKPVPRRRTPLLAGKIHVLRILLGAAVAVAGTLSASLLLHKALALSGGKLETTHAMQDRLITWEIKAVMLILGGALAGATTTNGIKQGLFVGLVSSVALITFQTPIADAWLEFASLTAVSTFALCVAGGWFGGALFPPVVKFERTSSFV